MSMCHASLAFASQVYLDLSGRAGLVTLECMKSGFGYHRGIYGTSRRGGCGGDFDSEMFQ